MNTPRTEHLKQHKGLNIKFGHPSTPNTPPAGSEEWTPLEDIKEPLAQLYSMQYKISTIARAENEKLKNKFELEHIPEIDERNNTSNTTSSSDNSTTSDPATCNSLPSLNSNASNSFIAASCSNSSSPKVRSGTFEQRRRSVLSDDSNTTCVDDSFEEDKSFSLELGGIGNSSNASIHDGSSNNSINNGAGTKGHRYHMRSSSLGNNGDLSDLFMYTSLRMHNNFPTQSKSTYDPTLWDASKQLLTSISVFLQTLRRTLSNYGTAALVSGVIILLAYLFGKASDSSINVERELSY